MKKALVLGTVISAVLVLGGCANQATTPTSAEAHPGTIYGVPGGMGAGGGGGPVPRTGTPVRNQP